LERARTTLIARHAIWIEWTSYGLNELSPSFLYEITDTLFDTTIGQAGGETFNVLYSAASDISIRGVAFAPQDASSLTPTPLPAS
jgi:hypothetical protein